MEIKKTELEQLLKWNEQGIIPGPEENFDSLSKRALYCLQIENLLKETGLIPEALSLKESAFIKESFPKTEHLFGIKPGWVPIFFSNASLFPWDGGASVIFQLDEEVPESAFIQLRAKLLSSKSYLGYEREELIAHEMAHIGRMAFNEPEFEEMLAWQTSNSSFRNFWGPIFSSQKESALFAFLLIGLLLFDILSFISSGLIFLSLYLKIIPLLFIGFLILKLLIKRYHFKKTLSLLNRMLKNPKMANAFIYRLKDEEIKSFSNKNENEIMDYMNDRRQKSLRWELIFQAYGKNALRSL